MFSDPISKEGLRKEALQKRGALTAEEILDFNDRILSLFSKLSFSGIRFLHSFLPIITRYEPNTLLLLDWLRNHHPNIRLVLPKSDFSTFSMQHFLWNENTVMSVNPAGIPEPVGGTAVDPALLDLIIVPLLVVDKRGNRIGYGKGFYDRFLAECRPDALKIGLSFFDAVPVINDVSPFDIPLDACITPFGVLWFNEPSGCKQQYRS